MSENKCGTCTACCRVYAIPAIDKPAGKWCEHCTIGKCCNIYETRPKACVTFECMWLQSQSIPGKEMVPELRPDRCKVVFAPSTNEKIFTGITMPGEPYAYKRKRVAELIVRLNNAGVAVSVGPPASTRQLFFDIDGTSREVRMTEPDENGMQWAIPEKPLTGGGK